MNHQLVFLVEPNSDKDQDQLRLIEDQIRSVNVSLLPVIDSDAVQRIRSLTASGGEPAVVVIGPGISPEIPLARAIRAVWPSGQILFAPLPSALPRLRQELQHAPMLGPNWTLLDLRETTLPKSIERAIQVSRQQVRLRTTLDRANIKLSAPRPVDSLDYRRLVISEHYLANLLQQSSDAIVSLSKGGTVLYWSHGAERLFGLSAKEVAGAHVEQLPFWSAPLSASLENIHGGSEREYAQVSCSLFGRDTELEIHFSRVHDRSSALIGVSITARDISERNRMLEMERAARREAERMSRMKDEFLAVLSHELRTPLSVVIGRAQLLQTRHGSDPNLAASLAVILRNAQLQAKLIEDLLDVSSIISGKLHLDLQPVAIESVIRAAIDSVRPAAERKKIRIREAVTAHAMLVSGDSYRLQQVLNNLLSNAIKFTGEGGMVEVNAGVEMAKIRIVVRDDGMGISPEFLPLVFDRFGQEDASTTRRHGGLGLGLSIAKQLVELHGGTIHVASAGRGHGACFTITLPSRTETQSAASAAETAPSSSANNTALEGCRILVVEDVDDTRALIAEVLQNYGATVHAVSSAAAALQSLDERPADILISDIGMPEMDGYELLARIRAKGITEKRLPALALTAFAGAADRKRALDFGYQFHLPKPMIFSDLIEAIIRLVRQP